jgi:hypothetical protein
MLINWICWHFYDGLCDYLPSDSPFWTKIRVALSGMKRFPLPLTFDFIMIGTLDLGSRNPVL